MQKRILMLLTLVGYALLLALSASAKNTGLNGVPATPTFSNEVVRILQANCQICHRPGDIAPFPLLTFEDASRRANAIRRAVVDRRMPPWKPVDSCGEFAGARRLSPDDIDTIVRWADAGAPEGDPADLPPPLEFPTDWRLGDPNVELQPMEDYTPSFTAMDDYRCFSMPTYFKEERWLRALDIQPGNRQIVHHVLLFIDDTGVSELLDAAEEGPGYACFGGPGFTPNFLNGGLAGGWAPGSQVQVLPPGIGIRVPAGARLVMQVHYSGHSLAGGHSHDLPEPMTFKSGGSRFHQSPNDGPPSDRTRLGLYDVTEPVQKQLRVLPLANQNIFIPAGAPRHRQTARLQVPLLLGDLTVLLIAPHMHLLGKEIEAKVTRPGGEEQCMIKIDDWDFMWQGFYGYAKPVPLPAGSILDLVAYYDNSPENPRNPSSPPIDVRWGERTIDEMLITFFGFVLDREMLSGATDPQQTMAIEEFRQSLQMGFSLF